MDWNVIGVIIGIISIFVAIFLWYISNKVKKKDDTDKIDSINSNKTTKTKSIKNWEIIYENTILIEATGYEEIHFDLIKGDKIKGIVRETEGDLFDFYIMKESDFDKFVARADLSPFKEYEDIPSQSFKFTVPQSDCWYFVFDTYGKQLDRKIIVTIRKLSA